MSGREAILKRVREALATPTSPVIRGEPHVRPDNEAVYAAPLDSHDDRVAAFAELSAALKTNFHVVAIAAEAHDLLKSVAAEEKWGRVASHHTALAEAACDALALPTLWTDGGYDADELEQCPASITTCDALVAQTASVLVTSRTAGGRALSVLPEHHIVLATAEQLVADLDAAYAIVRDALDGDAPPSFSTLITGPSRTGDIERVLVLGAHGPKRLTVILIEDP